MTFSNELPQDFNPDDYTTTVRPIDITNGIVDINPFDINLGVDVTSSLVDGAAAIGLDEEVEEYTKKEKSMNVWVIGGIVALVTFIIGLIVD